MFPIWGEGLDFFFSSDHEKIPNRPIGFRLLEKSLYLEYVDFTAGFYSYRALAQKWHPDHYDGEEKKKAEKMFIDIAAAKEVLTDEGKYK